MSTKINILVFPCGSEIGLDIHRALRFSSHVNLIGGSSADDHGRFVYKNYIEGIPFVNDPKFISSIKKIVAEYSIQVIYPAMDSVIATLKKHEKDICTIVGSPSESAEICLSKTKTYKALKDIIDVPSQFRNVSEIMEYPVFVKPDVGYGSRGAFRMDSEPQVSEFINKYPESIILEYLPGREYTIDCFTNKNRELLFASARQRTRISNGISVRTSTNDIPDDRIFIQWAKKINEALIFRGAWFFQVKESSVNRFKLLEVASRFGGSSSVFRMQGVNFPLLSVFDAMGMDVEILRNHFTVELDRALNCTYKLDLEFKEVYVDFDDTVIIDGKLNTTLISVLYQFIQEGKKIILLTKHDGDLLKTLKEKRIQSLFDEIIHIKKSDEKFNYINPMASIFIDDSFEERKKIFRTIGIPVFSPDAVESLKH